MKLSNLSRFKFLLIILAGLLSTTANANQDSISKAKTKRMKLHLETQITIAATPAQVWEVFTDYTQYPEWNPFVKELTGTVAVNEKIRVQLPDMKFTPRILSYETNQELVWLGKLLLPGVFDGQHYFKLVDNGDGTTTFLHGEKFKGFLVGLMKKKLQNEIKPGFEAMNEALKARVEG